MLERAFGVGLGLLIGFGLGFWLGAKLVMDTVVESMNKDPGKWLKRAIEIQRMKRAG